MQIIRTKLSFAATLAARIFLLFSVFALVVFCSQACSGSSGSKGQGQADTGGDNGNSKGQGGQSTGGQGGGGQQAGAPSSNTYRVEIDMLAYDAADKIAQHISSGLPGKGEFIIYDTQAFSTVQLYEAYEAGISVFESAYRLVQSNETKSLEAGVAAAQTIVGTLATLRSTTEFGTQTVNLNSDALVAQLTSRLSGRVIVPKIFLGNLTGADDLGLGDWKAKVTEDHCADPGKTVPRQLACLLTQRNRAAGKPGFAEIDKLFQSFLGILLNINVSGNVTAPGSAGRAPNTTPDGTTTGKGPTDDSANPQASPKGSPANDSSNQTAIQVPALYLLVFGRRLERELKKNCPSPSVSGSEPVSQSTPPPSPNHLLLVQTTAAGGSYRIRHNFWWELFWTTPTPSFNGGAVVTYYLVDPCTSTIETSGVLRYMIDYGKFKDIKPEKAGANFK